MGQYAVIVLLATGSAEIGAMVVLAFIAHYLFHVHHDTQKWYGELVAYHSQHVEPPA